MISCKIQLRNIYCISTLNPALRWVWKSEEFIRVATTLTEHSAPLNWSTELSDFLYNSIKNYLLCKYLKWDWCEESKEKAWEMVSLQVTHSFSNRQAQAQYGQHLLAWSWKPCRETQGSALEGRNQPLEAGPMLGDHKGLVSTQRRDQSAGSWGSDKNERVDVTSLNIPEKSGPVGAEGFIPQRG